MPVTTDNLSKAVVMLAGQVGIFLMLLLSHVCLAILRSFLCLSNGMTITDFHQFLASGWTKITCVTGLTIFELGGVGVRNIHLTFGQFVIPFCNPFCMARGTSSKLDTLNVLSACLFVKHATFYRMLLKFTIYCTIICSVSC
jgi:hypothetical protein